MTRSLISFLASQPTFKIIRGLMTSSKPRHLRELASQYDLSPAGVSDIIRRLKAAGVLSKERKGNRRYLTLQMSAKEQNCFNELFSIYELDLVRERELRNMERMPPQNSKAWMRVIYFIKKRNGDEPYSTYAQT